ncbi:MAG: cupin domain-containing protein [Sedimentisphaerales bacterium]|nr:cupin domain-containing protein [Sedimentisphaerales bacterium]
MKNNALVIDCTEDKLHQKLLEGQPQTSGMRCGKVSLQPTQSCGEHSTNGFEEILVFLSGQGLILMGDKESQKVGKDQVCYIPPHTLHNVKNTGHKRLVYIYCVAPAKAS